LFVVIASGRLRRIQDEPLPAGQTLEVALRANEVLRNEDALRANEVLRNEDALRANDEGESRSWGNNGFAKMLTLFLLNVHICILIL